MAYKAKIWNVFLLHFLLCVLLCLHFKACFQAETIRLGMELVVEAALFLCNVLISLLRWPHCYVIREQSVGWPWGSHSEFTDSLTRDIRRVSFSHARWSSGSDYTKASGVQGESNRAMEAYKHLPSTNAPGTITPDIAHEFIHGGAHGVHIATSMLSYTIVICM